MPLGLEYIYFSFNNNQKDKLTICKVFNIILPLLYSLSHFLPFFITTDICVKTYLLLRVFISSRSLFSNCSNNTLAQKLCLAEKQKLFLFYVFISFHVILDKEIFLQIVLLYICRKSFFSFLFPDCVFPTRWYVISWPLFYENPHFTVSSLWCPCAQGIRSKSSGQRGERTSVSGIFSPEHTRSLLTKLVLRRFSYRESNDTHYPSLLFSRDKTDI